MGCGGESGGIVGGWGRCSTGVPWERRDVELEQCGKSYQPCSKNCSFLKERDRFICVVCNQQTTASVKRHWRQYTAEL